MSAGGTIARPLAALTSNLLARKGQAKPAMRPQGFTGYAPRHDDLGWNDLGPEALQPVHQAPIVLLQHQELADRIGRDKPVPAPRVSGPRTAFTLRLDEERHLRLRLASAVGHRSCQQLVTEALDALLGSMPELDELAATAKTQSNGNT